MWGLALALVLVGGLVKAAASKTAHRGTHDENRLRDLQVLLARDTLSLDEAEDGAVLARRLGKADIERSFKKKAESIKKARK